MKTYLVSMKWSGGIEPLAVGKNKKKLVKFACQKMREREGYGRVDKGAERCAPICFDDFEIEEVMVFKGW